MGDAELVEPGTAILTELGDQTDRCCLDRLESD